MVIPLGDHNPTRRTPVFTWLLIGLNVAVFVLLQPWTGTVCEVQQFLLRWAAIPAELAQGSPLDAAQLAQDPAAVRCGLAPVPGKPVYLAVLFSLFLHAGWIHLLGNMLYLGIFGNNIEDRFGRLGFLAFYLGSGAVATIAFSLPNTDSVTTLVGASGAVAGVLGSYAVLYPRAPVTVTVPLLLFFVVRLPAILVLGMWFVVQLQALQRPDLLGGGGVAYLAHVAGFLAGVAVTLVSRPRRS